MTAPRPAHPLRVALARAAALTFSIGALAALMLQASGTSGCRRSVDGTADAAAPSITEPPVTAAPPPGSTESTSLEPAGKPTASAPPAASEAPVNKPYYFPATKAAPMPFPQQAPNGSPKK